MMGQHCGNDSSCQRLDKNKWHVVGRHRHLLQLSYAAVALDRASDGSGPCVTNVTTLQARQDKGQGIHEKG